ncbi:hypothetical protein Q5Y75_22815 [Ruegeria sp. 2205SS24-7]|uniref:hypothetical protein n=1 Tax=Ruegeria discodermiae TaxID=3064389 RepID=UPI0027426E43|nr:hypothetical protein [Ruegeria sp. 2205SS24-7]MDP5220045.1 hypothetical protein [Ruegeria sp. 2205SS24-7]
MVRTFQLQDEDDRHVAAVALQEGADAICSDKKRDFGLSVVEALTADEFITDTIDLSPVRAISAVAQMRSRMSSVKDGEQFVELIAQRSLPNVARYLRQYGDRL